MGEESRENLRKWRENPWLWKVISLNLQKFQQVVSTWRDKNRYTEYYWLQRKGVICIKGEIKTLIRGRGYGFIMAEDGREIFFHETGLIDIEYDSLEQGQQVEFDVEKGPKGLRAVSVKLLTE